jgi:hypothetical protein
MKRNSHKSSYLSSLIFVLLSGMILMTGCEDEDPVIYDFRPISENFMQTYLTYTHLFFYIDQMAKSMEDSLSDHPTGSYSLRGGNVTLEPAAPDEYPKTFLIDFGGTGTDDIIAGRITGSITASYMSDGSNVAYEYEDLIIHNDSPTGTCLITNMGLSSGKRLFNFQVSENTFIRDVENDSAYHVTFDGYQQVLWSESLNELTMPFGSFAGQLMKSDSLRFLAIIDEYYKIIKEADCSYIRDGIFDFTVTLNQSNDEVGNGVVDFGFMNPSDCDNYVIAVVDGEVNRTEFIYLMDWVIF